ncbi:MAG: CvpA family protein [bacterium]|nr:CvpA family protein [bacterium]
MGIATILALVVIVVFALRGYHDGVIRRLLEVVGALVVVVLTARFAARLTPAVVDLTGWSTSASLVTAWIVLILGGLLAARALAILVSKILRMTILGWLDRLGGMICGAVLGLIVASLMVTALLYVPGASGLYARSQRDTAGRFIAGAAPNLARQARVLAGERFGELWREVSDEADRRVDDAAKEARKKLDEAKDEAADAARDAVSR